MACTPTCGRHGAPFRLTLVGVSDPVVLFDGTCNLCNGAVQFIVDHERAPTLRFASLQSEAAAELLGAPLPPGDPDSVVLVEDGATYTHSTAALRIARHLRAPYRWSVVFFVVPRLVRDAVYRFVAKNRYRWFGKSETCRVPTPELRARFL